MHGKVFLACALGGGVGTFVALQMWQPFWWLGLIVGWIVGYLAYDFREIVQAAQTAWRMATRPRSRVRVRIFVRNFTTMMAACSSIWPALVAMFYVVVPEKSLPVSMVISTIILTMASLFATSFITNGGDISSMRRFHLLYVYGYLIPWLLWQAVWQTVRFVPRLAAGAMMAIVVVVVACARFIRYLFILIHSELRLLCAFDATFGAAIGYFLGSAVIGALAGGVIGVLNFELVSKRLLHLVPSR